MFAHHAVKIDISRVSLISASLFADLLITEKLDEFIEKQQERANHFIQYPKYENLMHWIETERDFFIEDCNTLVQHYKPTEKELLPRLSQFVEENLL